MAQMIRLRNTGTIPQVIYLRDGPVRVVPNGTIVVSPESYAVKVRSLERVGVVGEPDAPARNDEAEALRAELEQLRAELAAAKTATTKVEDDVQAEDDAAYPDHQGGGKWLLSDGSLTKGGLSREAANELEAQLHQ